MSHIREVARSGVAVICSIHQPSQSIFGMSDKLLLLTKGDVAYFGPTKNAVSYFRARGCIPPPQTSVSEWLLEELNHDFHESMDHVQKLVAAWQSSSERLELDKEVREFVRKGKTSEPETADDSRVAFKSRYRRSFIQQTAVHVSRTFRDAVRSPAVIVDRGIMYLAVGVMIGVAWFRIPREVSRVFELTTMPFFTTVLLLYLSLSVLPAYLNEKAIITNERIGGGYSGASYLLGHLVVEVFYLGLLVCGFTALVYTMCGLHPKFSRGLFFAIAIWASLLAAESMMILLATIASHVFIGTAVGMFIFSLFMIVQGFLIPARFVPWPLRWVQYVAVHTYTYAALMLNEFQGRTYVSFSNMFPITSYENSGELYLNNFSFLFGNKWVNVGVLLAMTVIYRVLTFFWMASVLTGKR
jgi:ABC-2 type transporter